jgi:hypothetical protein
MEAVWGAVLSFLFVLATLSGYHVAGPPTSEQREQLEKQAKEQKEQFEKDQKEWKEQLEKQQKEQQEKSGKKEGSGKNENSEKKRKTERTDKSAAAKAPKQKSDLCTDNCADEWQLRH